MSWPSWDEDFFSASKCELDLNSAIHALRLMALDPYECAQLRRLWAEHIGSASIHMLSDEAIVQEIAHAVAHGRMELPKPFQHKPYIWAPHKISEFEALLGCIEVLHDNELRDWIEVLIVDEEHNPIPDVAYKIVLPDGSVRAGKTDEQGILRYDDIPQGVCQFSLIALDARTWESI